MQNKAMVVWVALLLDVVVGEPPNRWHPVVWMGRFISRMRKSAPQTSHRGLLLYGAGITGIGSLIVGLCGLGVMAISTKLPGLLRILMRAWLLKTTFSLRGLDQAGGAVEAALRAGDLVESRRLLSWHLVSRDTSALDAPSVAGAAISSVAENTSDGVIAPLFWYGVGGVPAALVYRYVNTGDSILGYRDAEHEWLGKIPARVDDALNFIPARVTACLFLLMRPMAWKVWRRDAGRTDSPNAGHPMSAMAGALDVRLEKRGHYVLNDEGMAPHAADLHQARGYLYGATAILVVLLTLLLRGKGDRT